LDLHNLGEANSSRFLVDGTHVKPPLRNMFPLSSGVFIIIPPSALILAVTCAVLATALAKQLLLFDELMSDSIASNTLRAEVCLSFCGVLVSWVILTTIYILGNVDHDLHYPFRKSRARHDADQRGLP